MKSETIEIEDGQLVITMIDNNEQVKITPVDRRGLSSESYGKLENAESVKEIKEILTDIFIAPGSETE